VVQKRGVSVI